MKKNNFSDKGSLAAVKRELRRSRNADVIAVHIALKRFWEPLTIWRSIKFIFKNRKRQKVLARMARARMGFDWRCAMPKKKQRELGLLPKIS